MSFFRLHALAASAALRSQRVYGTRPPFQHSLRSHSIFQEFSKKLKGEIDSNKELKKSIQEIKEKADTLKSRTKETAEHLYKHVDAARGEAETRAKQVSSVIKEKISEASEQVRETVASVRKDERPEQKEQSEEAEKQTTTAQQEHAQQEHTEKQTTETGTAEPGQTAGSQQQKDTQENKNEQQSTTSSTGVFSGVLDSLRKGKIAAVAKEGYNLLAEELTSTRRVKNKPTIPRSSVTAVVPVVKNTSGWRKRLDDMKEKVTSSFNKTVKDHPVVQKSHEIAEEMRERWETSDSPVVHKIQDLNDTIFGETANAAAMKEIRNRDPTFSIPDFIMEVQEDIRPVLTAYLKGDFIALRKKCSKEVVERCRAEHRALKSQGLYIDNKILYISDVELKEYKLIGNEPIIIISFQTQQSYCVRDEFGHIREGSKDDIRTVYYAWAMQQVPQEEMDPEEFTPRWQLREMQQLGVQAII